MTTNALLISLAVALTASSAAAACPSPAENSIEIYPTANELPENLLRMYIYYPRPMAVTEGLKHVALLDRTGERIDHAFLATNQELWSPDKTRLTVLLDPGRVKSGLEAHELLGRALVPGQSYTLVVSGTAMDANGCPLGVDGKYNFSVTVADDDPPAPAAWSVDAPRLASTDPVRVDLGSTHDHLSMAYRLRVVDDAGNAMPGSIALGAHEAEWFFTPRLPWSDAEYAVAVDQRLEDLAGNRPGVLFDRPTSFEPMEWQDRLPFTPTKKPD
ncbi:MAG: hypothetical protein AAFR73_08660 [Pseudomonadota bacterium]